MNEINAMLSGDKNPQDLVKKAMEGFTPYQKQNVLNMARNIGVPDNIIEEVQNMK